MQATKQSLHMHHHMRNQCATLRLLCCDCAQSWTRRSRFRRCRWVKSQRCTGRRSWNRWRIRRAQPSQAGQRIRPKTGCRPDGVEQAKLRELWHRSQPDQAESRIQDGGKMVDEFSLPRSPLTRCRAPNRQLGLRSSGSTPRPCAVAVTAANIQLHRR